METTDRETPEEEVPTSDHSVNDAPRRRRLTRDPAGAGDEQNPGFRLQHGKRQRIGMVGALRENPETLSPVQALVRTLGERDRQLQEREEELLQLRQEHVRLAGRIWLVEGQLLAAKQEVQRRMGVTTQEAEPPTAVTNRPGSNRLSGAACPYLASYANRTLRSSRPSAQHVCYAIGNDLWAYGPADLEVQQHVCTRKNVYSRCPRFRDAAASEVLSRQHSDPAGSSRWKFWRKKGT